MPAVSLGPTVERTGRRKGSMGRSVSVFGGLVVVAALAVAFFAVALTVALNG